MLTIAGAKACGYSGSGHIRLAAAVEFMHTATLLHDDVVDDSDFRRGKKSARMIWGNQASVLVGDFLLGQAFRMMVEVGSLARPQDPVERRGRHRRGRGDAAGRRQEHGHHRGRIPGDHQRQDRRPVLGGHRGRRRHRPPSRRRSRPRSSRYGRNLGIAFQLVDDALDYAGESARLGKSIGDDFREGKITLPVILCFRRGAERRARVLEAHAERGQDRGRRLRPRRAPHEDSTGPSRLRSIAPATTARSPATRSRIFRPDRQPARWPRLSTSASAAPVEFLGGWRSCCILPRGSPPHWGCMGA